MAKGKFEGFDIDSDAWPGPAKDYPAETGKLLRKERRAVERNLSGDFWTYLKRTEVPWPIVILICVVLVLLAGCGSDSSRPEPIYIVEGEMLDDARSWCFSNDGVDYFTMEDNDAELLVCNDGRTVDRIWYTP